MRVSISAFLFILISFFVLHHCKERKATRSKAPASEQNIEDPNLKEQHQEFVEEQEQGPTGTPPPEVIASPVPNPPSNDPIGQTLDELVNPQELKDCQNKKQVFDRVDRKCLVATLVKPGTGWCTEQNIPSEFKDIQGVDQTLKQLRESGFELDQCGKGSSQEPVVILMKIDAAAGSVDQRKICYKGSIFCPN